jgi:SagB-type dehydrogenase family enzyme
MENILKLSLRDDVELLYDESSLRFKTDTLLKTFSKQTDFVCQLFQELKTIGDSENELLEKVIEEEGFEGLMGFTYILKSIDSLGFLNYHFSLDEDSQIKLVKLSSHFEYEKFEPQGQNYYKLSKMSLIRKEGTVFVFESPLAKCRLEFNNPAVANLISLFEPILINDWINQFQHKNELMLLLLEFLYNTECLQLTDEKKELKEENLNNPEAYWEFHDLYFHSRSRLGRHNNAYGGTFPFGKKTIIPPMFKKMESKIRIDLHKPNIQMLMDNDISLTKAIEERKSIREHGTNPITFEQLSEFLYRTNRVSEVVLHEQTEYSKKIYPSGGGLYELEIYPIINLCEGIDRGLYYYDPNAHQLALVKEYGTEIQTIVGLSAKTIAMEGLPQVTFIITARFQRLAHKYRSVTYALILKHVGVLYQQMYLVATSMNLAPCALGGGDSDLFVKMADLNYMEEASVGEFLLGTKT